MSARSATVLGWVALAVAGCAGSERSAPSVVLVVIDTLRADHLGCYGYPRDTSPNLDRLAGEAVRYTNAWSPAPWTLPSIASILTGEPPWVHGAGRDAHGTLRRLRDDVPTLAERLGDRGYRTAAFVNVVFCGPRSGLDRGFDLYDFSTTDASNRGQRRAGATTDAALDWIERQADEPFFALVHYFDPHLTYDAPSPYATMFEPAAAAAIPEGFGSAAEVFAIREGRIELDGRRRRGLIARYDGEIRYVDDQFGRLRAGLERMGLWDDALVVVTADHGEEFWDHGGFEHGHSHHRELLQVPLILRAPRSEPATFDDRVRLIDLFDTVLAAAQSGGEVPRLAGATHAVARGSLWAGDLISVRSDAGTLIVDPHRGIEQRYGAGDPRERSSLPADGLPGIDGLRLLADTVLPVDPHGPETWTPSEEELERLRSLGYVR